MVDVRSATHRAVAVEAGIVLQCQKGSAYRFERDSLRAEQEPLQFGFGQPVLARNHHGPLAMEQRAQDAVEAHEQFAHARVQPQQVVEAGGTPALVR